MLWKHSLKFTLVLIRSKLNYLSFHLFKNILNLSSFLNNCFALYRILVWLMFTFISWRNDLIIFWFHHVSCQTPLKVIYFFLWLLLTFSLGLWFPSVLLLFYLWITLLICIFFCLEFIVFLEVWLDVFHQYWKLLSNFLFKRYHSLFPFGL